MVARNPEGVQAEPHAGGLITPSRLAERGQLGFWIGDLAPVVEPQTPAPSVPEARWSAEAHFDAAFARVTERLSHGER